jgi:hypothetical protein
VSPVDIDDCARCAIAIDCSRAGRFHKRAGITNLFKKGSIEFWVTPLTMRKNFRPIARPALINNKKVCADTISPIDSPMYAFNETVLAATGVGTLIILTQVIGSPTTIDGDGRQRQE